MEFSIKFDTVKSGWSIIHIDGVTGYNLPKYCISFFEDGFFVLVNSADTDEIPHQVAFHLGFHCLPKYPFRGFWSTNVLIIFTID